MSPVFNPAVQDDPFDQLFTNMNTERMRAPVRDPLSFSSANTTAQSNHSEEGFGLFQSFSDEPTPLIKKKPIRSYKSAKRISDSRKEEAKENVEEVAHSTTLLRELKFSSSTSSLKNVNSYPKPPSPVPSPSSPHSELETSVSGLTFPSATKTSVPQRSVQSVSSPHSFFLTPG